jgi:hypothetical protein
VQSRISRYTVTGLRINNNAISGMIMRRTRSPIGLLSLATFLLIGCNKPVAGTLSGQTSDAAARRQVLNLFCDQISWRPTRSPTHRRAAIQSADLGSGGAL